VRASTTREAKVLKPDRFLLASLMFGVAMLAGCSRQEPAPAPPPAVEAPPPAPPSPASDVGAELAPGLAARLVRDHSPVIGPAIAPVTLVEFLDPACEACAAYAPVVRQIELVHAQDVRIVVRFAAFHPGSEEAIRLLDAAQRQGKFEATLDALFANQEEWASHHAPNLARAWEIAGAAGVDLARAKRDSQDSRADRLLRVEGEDIIALTVERTPTFFINGRPLTNYGPQSLMKAVAEEVARAHGMAPG
jgi:protein-disulfide isomerase